MVLRCTDVSTNPANAASISQAFDREASGYSQAWESQPLIRVFRARVIAAVVRSTPLPARVLDLGCGIGTDARLLGALGYDVFGVDVSPKMVERAVAAGVHAQVLRVQDVRRVVAEPYDVVLSNFGALNCVPLLDAAAAVRLSVRSGGVFVCVTISKHCPAEWMALAAQGRWPFRRGAVVPVKAMPVPMHYATPARWAAALGTEFACEGVEALGLLAAPPDLGGQLGLGSQIEPYLARLPGLRLLGDHTLTTFRRS